MQSCMLCMARTKEVLFDGSVHTAPEVQLDLKYRSVQDTITAGVDPDNGRASPHDKADGDADPEVLVR